MFTRTWLMVTALAASPSLSTEPPLKPNHPNHSMNTPSVTTSTLEGGLARTVPSRRNLPSRGPATIMPASAAQPPVLCTIVEPAKSLNPNSSSQPPPQVQAPTTGYSTAVRTSVKMKKLSSLTRSAIAPEMMDAVVATNTIWKNQSDMVAYSCSATTRYGRGGGLALRGANQCDLVCRGAVQQLELADKPAQQVAVHEVVANDEVGQTRDGVQANVLQADHGGVLGAHRAGFEHGEAGAHPHDQRAPHQEGEGVEDERGLAVHGGVGDGRSRGEQTHRAQCDGGDGKRAAAVAAGSREIREQSRLEVP